MEALTIVDLKLSLKRKAGLLSLEEFLEAAAPLIKKTANGSGAAVER